MSEKRDVTARGLRLIEIPDSYLPDGVSGSAFDPDTLRAAAEAHSRHPFDHTMEVKSWVVLYLLDAWEEPNV